MPSLISKNFNQALYKMRHFVLRQCNTSEILTTLPGEVTMHITIKEHQWKIITRIVNETSKPITKFFEMSCYLLFFHVCNTSESVRLSSLACVSRRSNRNLIAGGKLQPRRYFIKTVWKSRSTNCCRVPCQSYSKSN